MTSLTSVRQARIKLFPTAGPGRIECFYSNVKEVRVYISMASLPNTNTAIKGALLKDFMNMIMDHSIPELEANNDLPDDVVRLFVSISRQIDNGRSIYDVIDASGRNILTRPPLRSNIYNGSNSLPNYRDITAINELEHGRSFVSPTVNQQPYQQSNQQPYQQSNQQPYQQSNQQPYQQDLFNTNTHQSLFNTALQRLIGNITSNIGNDPRRNSMNSSFNDSPYLHTQPRVPMMSEEKMRAMIESDITESARPDIIQSIINRTTELLPIQRPVRNTTNPQPFPVINIAESAHENVESDENAESIMPERFREIRTGPNEIIMHETDQNTLLGHEQPDTENKTQLDESAPNVSPTNNSISNVRENTDISPSQVVTHLTASRNPPLKDDVINKIAKVIHHLIVTRKTRPPDFTNLNGSKYRKIKNYIHNITKVWLSQEEINRFLLVLNEINQSPSNE